MLSAEPFTIRGCGYPNLLASGELCDGDGIHDKQHPHDLVMELAAEYSPGSSPLAALARLRRARPASRRSARWRFPTAPPPWPTRSRRSRTTGSTPRTSPTASSPRGLTAARWRLEGSVFNGREPDDERHDFDFGPLDSFSARLQLAPTDGLALQVSAGGLESAEAGEGSSARRATSRASPRRCCTRGHSRGGPWRRRWPGAATPRWATRTHAALAEGTLTLTPRHTVFARAEVAGKRGHDLHIHENVLADLHRREAAGRLRAVPGAVARRAGRASAAACRRRSCQRRSSPTTAAWAWASASSLRCAQPRSDR